MLRATRFCLDAELDILSMNLQQAVNQNVEEDENSACKIGTMKVAMSILCSSCCTCAQVHVELLPSSGKGSKDIKLFNSSPETVVTGSDVGNEEPRMESMIVPRTENRIKLDVDRVDDNPPLLQMLLMIPNGFGMMLPSSQQDADKAVPPNSYLVCKVFCCDPYPKTQPVWNSSNPTFSFRQTFSLRLSKSLLAKMCNNFMVVEVWHKTAGNIPDMVSTLNK